ncbi:hypothetical protein [Sandaracinus amylolyticus]|uniref:hypothetical protein n=1 Tax=Sandaracinus amylolyticus TaxID=927083 RepID=UPI001F2AC98D|nr:hypothetical protein [Sandaracinus amylolyticus]UJR85595.1 Hypothetical protein I5071_76750 [Sandaracinus amylolyticus]
MRTWLIAAVAAGWLFGCGGAEEPADETSAKPDEGAGGEIHTIDSPDRGLAPPDDPALPF